MYVRNFRVSVHDGVVLLILEDETQDQATDGVPDTGFYAFGSTANKRNNS